MYRFVRKDVAVKYTDIVTIFLYFCLRRVKWLQSPSQFSAMSVFCVSAFFYHWFHQSFFVVLRGRGPELSQKMIKSLQTIWSIDEISLSKQSLLCQIFWLPSRGLSDVTGMVAETMLRNTVKLRRIVTPANSPAVQQPLMAQIQVANIIGNSQAGNFWGEFPSGESLSRGNPSKVNCNILNM